MGESGGKVRGEERSLARSGRALEPWVQWVFATGGRGVGALPPPPPPLGLVPGPPHPRGGSRMKPEVELGQPGLGSAWSGQPPPRRGGRLWARGGGERSGFVGGTVRQRWGSGNSFVIP